MSDGIKTIDPSFQHVPHYVRECDDPHYELVRLADSHARVGRAMERVAGDLAGAGNFERAERMEKSLREVNEKLGVEGDEPSTVDSARLIALLITGHMTLRNPGIMSERGVWTHRSELRRRKADGKIVLYYHVSYTDKFGTEAWDSGEIDFD